MKKLLGIVVLGLLWCNVAIADIKMSEYKAFKDSLYEADGLVIQVFCVDGYKFVSTERSTTHHSGKSNAISTVQFMKMEDGKMVPAKCK